MTASPRAPALVGFLMAGTWFVGTWFATGASALHPANVSLSELATSEDGTRWEVGLRLSLDDAHWIDGGQWAGSSPPPPNDRVERRTEYLRKRYRIDDARYHWVGSETDGGHVWWFFEIEPVSKPDGRLLTVTMLADRPVRGHAAGQFGHRLFVRDRGVGYDLRPDHASVNLSLDPAPPPHPSSPANQKSANRESADPTRADAPTAGEP